MKSLAPLGAGGMGEVYKATDTRLHRTVAIKVLLSHVAGDPAPPTAIRTRSQNARLAEVTRTSVQSTTSAPWTAPTIWSWSFSRGDAGRPPRTAALPLDQALKIGDPDRGRARHGSSRRDRAPRSEARQHHAHQERREAASTSDSQKPLGCWPRAASTLPTTAPDLTVEGTILGTVPYMAPEQLEGREADARTDIFALGAVLFEMIAGRRAFDGPEPRQLD